MQHAWQTDTVTNLINLQPKSKSDVGTNVRCIDNKGEWPDLASAGCRASPMGAVWA